MNTETNPSFTPEEKASSHRVYEPNHKPEIDPEKSAQLARIVTRNSFWMTTI